MTTEQLRESLEYDRVIAVEIAYLRMAERLIEIGKAIEEAMKK